MSQKKITKKLGRNKPTDAAELHQRAEARLGESKRGKASRPGTKEETQRLIHKLQVRQIELEKQNEELQQARRETEKGLEQYADLYDSAPVGYFILNREGVIHRVNLTGAGLLEMGRSRLVDRLFGLFVSQDSHPDFNAFLEKAFARQAKAFCEVTLLREGHPPFWAHLEGRASEDGQSCRVAVVDITERKKVEEETKLSASLIHSLSRYANDFIILLDENFRFLEVNERVVDYYGYTHEELIGMHASQLRSPDTKEEFNQQIKIAQVSGKALYETVHQRKDGSVFPVEISLHAIDNDGKRFYQAVIRDITERKQAEIALKDRMEDLRRLATVVSDSNDAVILHDFDGKILAWNRGAKETYGYTETEALGKNVREIVADADREAALTLIQRIQQGDIVKSFELRRVTKDGRILDVWLTTTLLTDEKGKPVAIATTERDITERKQAEIALKDKMEDLRRLATVVSDSNDAVILHDFEGKILAWNRGAKETYGYTETEALGKNVREIVADADREAALTLIQRIQQGDIVKSFELRRVTKDGRILDVWLTTTLLTDEKGKPVAIATTERDITERKRAEEEVKELNTTLEQRVTERTAELVVAKDRAEEADRLKSAFLATMSHELRTPLNSIIGFTSILLQELAGPLNAEQRKQLEMVRDSGRHLLALINDVLDISKIEAGQLEVRSEPFDLRASIENVAGIVHPLAVKKGLDLHVELAPDIGTFVSDARRVEQVLLNLLNNAIKFTERGKVTLTAEIAQGALCAPNSLPASQSSATRQASVLRISVADTGIGIKPEDFTKLFLPFRQIDSSLTRQHEGTGLGLAICRRLADLLGGEIHATSEWGKGSVFTFTLPMKGRENP
jgi:PAS domain S-box-containing protein